MPAPAVTEIKTDAELVHYLDSLAQGIDPSVPPIENMGLQDAINSELRTTKIQLKQIIVAFAAYVQRHTK